MVDMNLDAVHSAIDRVKVVLTSAVTWITTATVLIQLILTQYGDVLPQAWQDYVVQALAFLTGLVLVIRRVTPVDKEDRGIL